MKVKMLESGSCFSMGKIYPYQAGCVYDLPSDALKSLPKTAFIKLEEAPVEQAKPEVKPEAKVEKEPEVEQSNKALEKPKAHKQIKKAKSK